MTNLKEESKLHACPFCGRSMEDFRIPADATTIRCPCISSDGMVDISLWQNAFCWKLLDESRERERKYREALQKISNSSGNLTVLSSRVCDQEFARWALKDSEDK